MMIVIVLHRGNGLISRAIMWQTRGRYSHASVIFPDGWHFEAREGKGVQWHKKFEPNKGDVCEFFQIPITEAQLERMIAFANRERGAKYDWRSVFAFLTRTTPSSSHADKWFCSEIVVALLADAGIRLFRATEPWEVDPDMLARSPVLPEPVPQ